MTRPIRRTRDLQIGDPIGWDRAGREIRVTGELVSAGRLLIYGTAPGQPNRLVQHGPLPRLEPV